MEKNTKKRLSGPEELFVILSKLTDEKTLENNNYKTNLTLEKQVAGLAYVFSLVDKWALEERYRLSHDLLYDLRDIQITLRGFIVNKIVPRLRNGCFAKQGLNDCYADYLAVSKLGPNPRALPLLDLELIKETMAVSILKKIKRSLEKPIAADENIYIHPPKEHLQIATQIMEGFTPDHKIYKRAMRLIAKYKE